MKIDVCLACFNGEKHIHEQVASILRQLPADGRILISDDGSTDGTIGIIQEFGDERIHLHQGPGLGVTKNFEFLCKLSSADVVFFSDQDDVWVDEKIELMSNELHYFDLVVSNAEIFGDNLSLQTPKDLFSWRHPSDGFWSNIARNGFVGCTMAFRRDVLEVALPFPSTICMHDQWIGLLAVLLGRVKIIDIELIKYRRHSLNATNLISSQPLYLRVWQRFSMIYLVLIRVLLVRFRKCTWTSKRFSD